ncbi:MAG: type IV secretion system DNA-binding domain-containing protein, partial [Clostridia bacterium]|nr:type IV secretion system DNA-binding domain-containing protein [Clostridia bacterium]
VILGNRFHKNIIPELKVDNAKMFFYGKDGKGNEIRIPLSEELLSRHLMLIGGIGTGKTNTINQYVSELRKIITTDDIAIIFDTKGDFYNLFYRPGDVVISNDETACDSLKRPNYWNIFKEISNDEHIMESINEISYSLFKEACERTNQPFFPNAARDIFSAILWDFVKNRPVNERTNRFLSKFLFKDASIKELKELLNRNEEFRALISYIDNETSNQTQGVIAELQRVTRNYFQSNFNMHGTLGISDLTRQKGGRFIFIEYDLNIGTMLTPIYSLMFDIAIKQAIGRDRSKGNVYFITDEFRLLPNLVHIDDAVNFGRSLGVKFLISIQNINQIYENYGEQRARSIMSGFLTTISFRVTDEPTRDFIKSSFGKNRKKDSFGNIVSTRGLIEETREGFVVEDWDITNLDRGHAIIGMPGIEPFLFDFKEFKEQEYKATLKSKIDEVEKSTSKLKKLRFTYDW